MTTKAEVQQTLDNLNKLIKEQVLEQALNGVAYAKLYRARDEVETSDKKLIRINAQVAKAQESYAHYYGATRND